MGSIKDENLGVVVVDDDPSFRKLICATTAALSKFTLHEAASGSELDHVLSDRKIDCIVLDYDLGHESGLLIKQRIDDARPGHAPVVMLTGATKEDTAIRAFRMGVADYLPKRGLKPEHLVEAIGRVVEEDRKKVFEKVQFQRLAADSAIDPLSGLEGRHLLDERLQRLAALPPASRGAFAVLAIELVGYDFIVERFGLKSGDQALRGFGGALRRLTRPQDVVGRYSGGTFLMVANVNNEVNLIETIRNRLLQGLAIAIDFGAGNMVVEVGVMGKLCPAGQMDEASFISALFVGTPLERLIEPNLAGRMQAAAAPILLRRVGEPLTPAPVRAAEPVASPEKQPAADLLRDTDRRTSVRQRVYKRGLVHLSNPNGTINCTIRNISTGGAGIRLDAVCRLPDSFELEILGSGLKRPVLLRWHNSPDLGVQYVDR